MILCRFTATQKSRNIWFSYVHPPSQISLPLITLYSTSDLSGTFISLPVSGLFINLLIYNLLMSKQATVHGLCTCCFAKRTHGGWRKLFKIYDAFQVCHAACFHLTWTKGELGERHPLHPGQSAVFQCWHRHCAPCPKAEGQHLH